MSLGGPEDLQRCDLPFFSIDRVRLQLAAFSIDRVYINQQDIPERNQQVNMMSTIYHKAANVTVSLGPDEHNDAPAVFEDIKALIEGCDTILSAGGQFGGHFDEETGVLHWQLQRRQNCASALPGAIVNPDEDEKARLERFMVLAYLGRARSWPGFRCNCALGRPCHRIGSHRSCSWYDIAKLFYANWAWLLK